MSRLTEREQAVWDKRNAGLTFKQIAEDLGLCPATVSFAYRKAYRKIEYEKERFINTADNERLKVIAELEEWVGYKVRDYDTSLPRLEMINSFIKKLNEMKGGN